MFIFLFLILCTPSFAQEGEPIPLRKETEWFKRPSISYRPGLNYKNAPLDESSPQNRILSPSITAEGANTSRFGSVRMDGAGTKPSFSVDGFFSKDVSINEEQILLDMLPIDFASSVDIYKQNLYPIGVPTGSLIDFRLGQGRTYTSLSTRAGTIGNWYTKLQGEQLFKDGSTLYGAAADFLFKDYYYASPQGGFAVWDKSIYQRTAVLSKTMYRNWEFLISDVFLRSYDESGDALLTRNNLLAGARWRKGIGYAQATYNFTSLQADYPAGISNQYFGHYFALSAGAEARKGHFRWHLGGGYALSSFLDAPWAPNKNYLTAPVHGVHAFNVVAEGAVSVYKEEDLKPVNAEFAVALNQIASTEYGYTPVPSFTLAVRHRKGFYFSSDISRVYITPDLTTRFGFGLPPDTPVTALVPKDGLRVGAEVGFTAPQGRIYLQAGYSWFETSFRLANRSNVINVSKVSGWNAEIGGDLKVPCGPGALTELTVGLAYNNEVDGQGIRSPLLPMIKLTSSLGWRGVTDLWSVRMIYTLHWNIPDGGGGGNLTPRNYLDITARWRWFHVSILNILNQSFRPDPENVFSAYNPGVRAEFGFTYEWN